MNKFELFTMTYFVLDRYYENETDEFIVTVLSDMCPFTFKDIGSADPAMFTDFCEFIEGKEITLDNSFDLAKEYVKTIDFADVTPAMDSLTEEQWLEVCNDYLSQPHKGSDEQ